MPRWKSADIDTIDDFEYAEFLYARHFANQGKTKAGASNG
jgi:CMP-N-acetylneuraminic acid synthetase